MSIEISNKRYAVIHTDTINNQDKVISANGDYYADDGYTGLGLVRVNVPAALLTTLNATANGTYTPPTGYNGFSQAIINVDNVNNLDTTLSTDGVYNAPAPYTGFGTVTVDLSAILTALQDLNAGDAETTVRLQNKTITTAGSYTADAGYDGLGTVTVNLDWVDAAITAAGQGTPNGTADDMIGGSIISISSEANTVRDYAFYNQSTLKKVILTSAANVGEYAFANTALETLTINIDTMCTLSDANAFDGVTTLQAIKVPSALVNTYKTDTNWSNFADKIVSI